MRRKAIFLLYRALTALVSPALAAYLMLRCLRDRRYFATLAERFGELPALWQKTAPGVIWLHAVSVGEVLAAVPLVTELRERAPGTEVYVSTSTLTGRETAEKRLGNLATGIFYAPFDLVWVVRKVLRRLRPSVVIVLETEIWPNLFRETRRTGAGLLIVNGRISDKAFPSYQKRHWLFSAVLAWCDRIVTQSDEMSRRFIAAGAPTGIVSAAGNLKYDFKPGVLAVDSPVIAFLAAAPEKPVWIAASTSADDSTEEEDAVVAAQRALSSLESGGWRLILAPRKPERFDRVARKLADAGLRFTRRTNLADPAADVLLLDSIGELSASFAHAGVVFMGGTLAEKGGHNVLEPAVFGKPVIAGPHLENFRDIEVHFTTHQALLRIGSGAELAMAVTTASADLGLGPRALMAAGLQQGAAGRIADEVLALYQTRYPVTRAPQPSWMILWCFAQLWAFFSARDRNNKIARASKLPVPVVSVGNITAGGTGKTPLTIELMAEFESPALLTRGYGRNTPGSLILWRGNERVPTALTGDEAQLYLRRAKVPMGIGANRFEVGQELLRAVTPKTIFLDDAFQHLQLKRDFDLVLVDSLNPFGGGHLIPLGRLREPLEGLARADAFLITRANESVNTEAIEHVLRKHNPTAAVFRARTVPLRWTNQNGDQLPPDGPAELRAVAFCGLGNPTAFWNTLDYHGITPKEHYDYGDHHRYTPVELRRLARRAKDIGANTLLTTEKDAVNLCQEVSTIIRPLDLWWLEIGMDIDRRDELLALIRQAL